MKFVNLNEFDATKYEITAEEFLTKRKESNVMVIDIRIVEAYEANHLAGAYSLPLLFLEEHLMQIPPFADIIFYGDSDEESIQAILLLIENGFDTVSFVSGGYSGIQEELLKSGEVVLSNEDPAKWEAMIEEILDSKVRPALASDGGGMEVLKIQGDKLYVSYQGACNGCPSASAGTLRFIENTLRTSLNHDIEVIVS